MLQCSFKTMEILLNLHVHEDPFAKRQTDLQKVKQGSNTGIISIM